MSGQIGDEVSHVAYPAEHLREVRMEQRRNMERELRERLTKMEIEARHKKPDEENERKED